MIEHVSHPVGPAGQMERHARTHLGPAQAWAEGYGLIDFLDCRLARGDHVQGLAPHGLLQPVADETGQFAAESERSLADRRVEVGEPGHGPWASLLPADDLDERDEVRRVEWMTYHAAFRLGAVGLQQRHAESGRARRDNDVWAREPVDVRQ